MKQLYRISDIFGIAAGLVLLIALYMTRTPTVVLNSQGEGCYPLEAQTEEREFTTIATWKEMVQLRITTTVTKRDGTTITDDPNIRAILVMDNAVQGDLSNFKYALFSAYDASGQRADPYYYFLTTKGVPVRFKVKTYVDEGVAADYRLAEIQVAVKAESTQAKVDGAINDWFRLNMPTTYFNVPLPIEGTTDEYANYGTDNNLGYKEEALTLFTTIRNK